MMKIMKVVYSAKCQNSEWSSASGMYEEYNYLGEESWSIGENFNGEFVQGVVDEITQDGYSAIDIWVKTPTGALVMAMTIPPHAVQRIYYGEG